MNGGMAAIFGANALAFESDLWRTGISSVTERFFSGVPHAHLLGVCHRALFFTEMRTR